MSCDQYSQNLKSACFGALFVSFGIIIGMLSQCEGPKSAVEQEHLRKMEIMKLERYLHE